MDNLTLEKHHAAFVELSRIPGKMALGCWGKKPYRFLLDLDTLQEKITECIDKCIGNQTSECSEECERFKTDVSVRLITFFF